MYRVTAGDAAVVEHCSAFYISVNSHMGWALSSEERRTETQPAVHDVLSWLRIPHVWRRQNCVHLQP